MLSTTNSLRQTTDNLIQKWSQPVLTDDNGEIIPFSPTKTPAPKESEIETAPAPAEKEEQTPTKPTHPAAKKPFTSVNDYIRTNQGVCTLAHTTGYSKRMVTTARQAKQSPYLAELAERQYAYIEKLTQSNARYEQEANTWLTVSAVLASICVGLLVLVWFG